jgi:lactate dehydrogenase-like 2-hydroxyacid dehydrogenase
MARVLVSTPMLGECLAALDAHDLVAGVPGSDASAVALLCAPTQPVDETAIAAMPLLRVISVAGAGADAVDAKAATERKIEVLTAGEALVETTADLAFGLIIAACRQLHDVERTLREGRWEGWRFDQTFGRDVHGATLGLVGFGAIARAVARRAEGFGMQVLHHARHPTGLEGWRERLDDLLAESDIVSLHIPLTGATLGLIDRRRIGLMREGAVLVNTARGAVLDEDALAEALEEGRLLAAGLDVYVGEPTVSPRLLAAPRTVLLPHVGSATAATRRAMLGLAAEKLAAAL